MHRAQGLAGPTRRYAIIVILLVALASIPTLAAISAGAATLGASTATERTQPFLIQPPRAPIVIVPPAPATPPLGAARPADVAHRPSVTVRAVRIESVRRQPGPRKRPLAEPEAATVPVPRLGWRPFAGQPAH